MPTVQGNTMNTAALLGAAMPVQSWAQRRADRQQEILLRGYIGEMKQQDVQQEQLIQQQLMEQNQRLASLPILSPDQQRINAVIDEFRKSTAEKLTTKYNGDYKKYRDSELLADSQMLASKIIQSPLTRRANENKINFGMAREDVQKGDRLARTVTYRLNDGTVKTADWEQHYQDFNMGKTGELQYGGSYKKPKEYADYFNKTYNPYDNSPMAKYTPAGASQADIFNALVTQDGLSEQDARDYMKRAGLKDGSLRWKSDPLDYYKQRSADQRDRALSLDAQRLAIAQQKAAAEAAGGGGGGDYPLESRLFSPQNEIQGKGIAGLRIYGPEAAKVDGDSKDFPAAIGTEDLRAYDDRGIEKEVVYQMLGLGKDGKGRPELGGMVLMANEGSADKGAVPVKLKKGSYDVVSVEPGFYVGSGGKSQSIAVPGKETYRVVQVKMTSDQARENGLLSKWIRTPNRALQSDATQKDNKFLSLSSPVTYTTQMLVPIDLNNPQSQFLLQNTPFGKLYNGAKSQERQGDDFSSPVLDSFFNEE